MDSPGISDEQPANAEQSDAAPTGLLTGKTLIGAVVAAVLGAFLLLSVFSGTSDTAVSEEDQDFASLAFLTADGETATLADFEGDPLVVNFFASWCGPCRAELPDFERVHRANIDNVRFVGINHDFEEQTWRSFVEETDITFETVFQPQTEIWLELDAIGTPATAFISAEGELLHFHNGVLNDEVLQELIDEHLSGRA